MDANFPVPADRFTAETPDGETLAVARWGNPNGPSLLFIHGFAQAGLSWAGQVSGPLAETFNLVTFDMRGHGASSKPFAKSAYRDSALWADDVAAVMKAASLDRPILVGWSFGGRVVGDYLATLGDTEIAGLVLVAPAVRTEPEDRGPVAALLRPMGDDDLAVALPATRDFVAGCFETPPAPAVLDALVVLNMMTPPYARRGLGGRAADYAAVFSSVSVPALVVHGDRDAIIPPHVGAFAADAIPGATLDVFEGIGHTPFMEDQPRFDATLERFARRVFRL
ncbi:MAG: alpha/beta hydrolase [Pseudomonadota bacterium]